MPRGELDDHVLLCAGRPTKQGIIHGLGMRKSVHVDSRWAKVVIAPQAVSSFTSDPDDKNPVLTLSSNVGKSRFFWIEPEITYIITTVGKLDEFEDTDAAKDPISKLLSLALNQTLFKFHAFCMVQIPGLKGDHPAFVFVSPRGKYTALTTTTKTKYSPGILYVNYLQTGLPRRTFWRPTCFITVDGESEAYVPEWSKPIDVQEVRTVVKSAVLTFNAFNCDHLVDEIDDEDDSPPRETTYSDNESPYSLG